MRTRILILAVEKRRNRSLGAHITGFYLEFDAARFVLSNKRVVRGGDMLINDTDVDNLNFLLAAIIADKKLRNVKDTILHLQINLLFSRQSNSVLLIYSDITKFESAIALKHTNLVHINLSTRSKEASMPASLLYC